MSQWIQFHKSSLSKKVLADASAILASCEQFQGGGILYNQAVSRLGGDYRDACFLTSSCTSALEMAFMSIAHSCSIDRCCNKVLLPSFAFSSCANAVLRAGLVPVFGDVNTDLNLCFKTINDCSLSEFCAVLALDYAGYPCFDESTVECLKNLGLSVVMDSAQSFGLYELGKPPFASVDYQVFSFHDTKTISTGEGGLLVCNPDTVDLELMSCFFEKGTNRRDFSKGLIAKYSWLSPGGSFVLSEINVALLLAQIDSLKAVIEHRQKVFMTLKRFFEEYDPSIKTGACGGSGHFFWILARDSSHRDELIQRLKVLKIQATTHYEPLHSSPYGGSAFKTLGNMNYTNHVAEVLLRLPTHDEAIGDLIEKL